MFFVTFCTHKHYYLTPGSRDIVLETCRTGNGKLFQLHAIVVMPDHVHLALTPTANEKGEAPIQQIMQVIKSSSAHRINKYLGRKGGVWQDESFDRAMRSTENFYGKVEYIVANPVRAGWVRNPRDYRWLWAE